ncbi:hypothetical protein GH714_006427 [Hevea brasiliensis]|uniref:Reverse transcriptase Ty1/copia-type domain-containing protein n=1 Tax=Hevea brasiliensis TaxID=3981 RepID=A0A6A6LEW6_HEVBR|nr:hypothetical protein GH714_006427 [Hevea brasiliensis]
MKKHLSDEFEMKDLGAAKKILGMEITRYRSVGKLFLSQQVYVKKVLKRFNMNNAKPMTEPFKLLLPSDQQDINSSPPPSITTEAKILPTVETPPAVAETKVLPEDSLSETRKSSLDVLTVTKGLLSELSSRTRKRKSTNPETTLEILLARVAEFRESIPMAMAIKETAEARIISLLGKATVLDARLEEREKKLSFLVTEFSRLSKEEENLEAEIQFLITQKAEILAHKKHVLADMEKTNDETSEDVEE